MTQTTKAAIRGLVYMAIISAVFGFWQNSWPAGVFMLLFLLFIEKLIRVLIVRGSQSTVGAEAETPAASEDDNDFLVTSDGESHQYVTLDSDINYRPCLNHFRFYSRYDTAVGNSEYEFRIDGTKVFLRLTQDCSENPGKGDEWEVCDGVVMESDMRARDVKSAFRLNTVDERIASLKKATEWCELMSSDWKGLKYFILSKKLPTRDARHFFRSELERLKTGVNGFTEELAKIGIERFEGLGGVRLIEGRPEPTDADITKAWESLPTYGISKMEFFSGNKIIKVLQDLLNEKS
jgi:hypothetical protein